jgi:outer membrane protein OmpA-like peptidoglycan-associated protein
MVVTRASWVTAIATVAALCGGSVAQAQTGQGKQVELGAYGTLTSFNSRSIQLQTHFGAGGLAAYYVSQHFSVELSGDYTSTQGTTTGDQVYVARLAGTIFNHRRVGGANTLYFGPGFERSWYTGASEFQDNGVIFRLGDRLPIGGRAALRLEGKAAYYPNSPVQAQGDHVFNLSGTLGLSIFSFGGPKRDQDADGVTDRKDKCPNTPAGAIVDGDGCPVDSDLDGVFDGIDQCPDTPAGAHVDAGGCPLDSDNDTIFDGIDQCPDTPAGATVDGTGCPLDSDNDKIFDGIDQCPGTPAGARVDETGCPTDEDMDGVYDGLDQCPGTPVGTEVDEQGCPPPEVVLAVPVVVDSDGDGILDDTDRCPNTAPGQQVDGVGCPILFAVVEETGEVQPLILQGVNFATGKSTLTRASYAVLDQVAASLLVHDDVRIEIAGHTDSTGRLSLNMRLSLARAEAVRAYLAQKGVSVDRMEAQGYGPDEPIATNSTAEGRAMNRRVELRLLEQP